MTKGRVGKEAVQHKKEIEFNGHVVMVAALTAAVVSVLLLSLWFYVYGFGMMRMVLG